MNAGHFKWRPSLFSHSKKRETGESPHKIQQHAGRKNSRGPSRKNNFWVRERETQAARPEKATRWEAGTKDLTFPNRPPASRISFQEQIKSARLPFSCTHGREQLGEAGSAGLTPEGIEKSPSEGVKSTSASHKAAWAVCLLRM
jgi:hypothetical protein